MAVTRRALAGAFGFSVLAAPFGALAHQVDRIPDRRDVQRVLRDRVAHISAGQNDFAIAAGWVGAGRARFASFGQLDHNTSSGADRDTAFEIGSITKAFTAIALADMVLRGELALDDPANRHLPSKLRLLDRNGRAITLLELATHTSGLPFMAPEQALASRADAEAWLRELHIEGAGWDYSNIGYWLLGEAMAARAGIAFEELLHARVLDRMQLRNTGFTPRTHAIGHDAAMRATRAITALPGYAFMPAAGGLYSSIGDLLRVVSIATGQRTSPLSSAIALTVNTRVAGASGAQTQALGWNIVAGSDEIVLRDGGTLGSAGCVAWNARRPRGVAVLSNQVSGVTDIARHLLDSSFPLDEPAPARHVEVSLSRDILDSFAGRYEHAEEGAFIVARDGDGLVLTLPESWGLPAMQLRAESPTDFFALELPLRTRFQRNDQDQVSGMLVYPPRGQGALPTTRAH